MTQNSPLLPINRRTVVLGGTLGLLSVASRSATASSDFVVEIARKYQSDLCTSGYLAVDGKVIAYTLELPWRGNKPLISSIPTGAYTGTLRYDHADAWRIELVGVPGRSNIQIHIGNFTSDIQGCVLVGSEVSPDLCALKAGTSARAYAALKAAFYGTSTPSATPDKRIVVKVTD